MIRPRDRASQWYIILSLLSVRMARASLIPLRSIVLPSDSKKAGISLPQGVRYTCPGLQYRRHWWTPTYPPWTVYKPAFPRHWLCIRWRKDLCKLLQENSRDRRSYRKTATSCPELDLESLVSPDGVHCSENVHNGFRPRAFSHKEGSWRGMGWSNWER